jgi:hypothetical protein
MPIYEERTPVYEDRAVSGGGSSMAMIGIFLISLLIIAVALVIIFHAALHLF